MSEYRISFSGEATVQADSPADAMDKFSAESIKQEHFEVVEVRRTWIGNEYEGFEIGRET